MNDRLLRFFAVLGGIGLCGAPLLAADSMAVEPVSSRLARIAFGSCADQEKPQPVLERVVEAAPDVFVYLGDNVYGDTRDSSELRGKYATLAAKPEFQKLRSRVPLLATWDDHDYGENDAGAEYPLKEASREIFLDFWGVSPQSERRAHAGIYGSEWLSLSGRQVQILLLDTRTFRSALRRVTPEERAAGQWKHDYRPDWDASKTVLGSEQWEWLERELRKPADLRVIASSIQFGHEYNGYESWTNFPLEQERMFELIRQTGAEGVVFISGDVHWSEISKREEPGLYPLYDVTASGITQSWHDFEPNRFRLGPVIRENHFGMIELESLAEDAVVTFRVIDVTGAERLREQVRLRDLRFAR